MARKSSSFVSEYNRIISDIDKGVFAPFYLLMGDEPYYSDCILEKIIASAVPEEQADFNRTIVYGSDVSAAGIVNEARRYPVFAERQLVVVKEAQMMKKMDDLVLYLENPLPTTVLVVSLTSASVDKRKSLYRKAKEKGVVFESSKLKDYEMPGWISDYVRASRKSIDPDAAVLLAESSGNDLRKVVMELKKLFHAMEEGASRIDVPLVEKNTGVTKEFSIFELTRALSFRDVEKAMKVAFYLGKDSKKVPMVLVVGGLAAYFIRLERFHAAERERRMTDTELAAYLGTFPGFLGELRTAARNFPLIKVIRCISLLEDYDYRSKSNASGEADDAELLMELVSKILAV